MKASKKCGNSSSDNSGSDLSLASDSIWDTYSRPFWRKEMNRLDHLVTDKLNNYKDQSNSSINSDPTFDTSNFNLSSGTSNPLPVVTVSIQVGKNIEQWLVLVQHPCGIANLSTAWKKYDTLIMMKAIWVLINYSISVPLACIVRLMMLRYPFACRNYLAAR